MALYDFRTIYLPYCLKKQENGEYVVLNREYKPVGFNTNKFIKYEDFPVSTAFKITKSQATKLSYDGSEDLSTIYLYNDGRIPTQSKKNMRAYLDRIELLMKLKVKDS